LCFSLYYQQVMKILCETRKETLNLTISARVAENDRLAVSKIKSLQTDIINLLPPQSRIGVYIYPEETLHFSILNLTSFDLDINFSSARNFMEQLTWYKSLKNYIKQQLCIPENYTGNIKKFYLNKDKDGVIEKSITLNINPGGLIEDFNKLKGSIKEELYKLGIPINGFGMKNYNTEFLGINILRFFGEDQDFIENCDKVYAYMENKNREFEKEPIKLKINKICLVVSDSYLSNQNPCISHD